MPGEWLMYVWHAAGARDKSGRATPAAIRNITESFSQFAVFDFSGDHYMSLFRGDNVDFDAYKRYVTDALEAAGAKATVTARQIEDSCWKIYDTAVGKRYMILTHDDTCKLWYVFNRLATVGSHPVSTTKTHVNWLCDNLAVNMDTIYGEVMANSWVSFTDLLAHLNKTLFVGVTTETIHGAVDVVFR